MINARREFAAVKFNNSIYVFGGENQFDKIVASIEKLDLMTDVDLENNETSPLNFSLEQNYPNPFNPTTTISFKIPQKSKVLLEIFDIFGKRIKTLIDDELKTGTYKVEWNGRDEKGNPLSSGIYIYRLSAGKVFLTKKMTLIK
jgi:flagellar hook assembly protein FlgD